MYDTQLSVVDNMYQHFHQTKISHYYILDRFLEQALEAALLLVVLLDKPASY